MSWARNRVSILGIGLVESLSTAHPPQSRATLQIGSTDKTGARMNNPQHVDAGATNARMTLSEMLAWCDRKLASGMCESRVRASLAAWLVAESAQECSSGDTCTEEVLDDLLQLRDMVRESKGQNTTAAESLRRLYSTARQRVLARMKMGKWYMVLRRGANGLATVQEGSEGNAVQGQELDALMEFARVYEPHSGKQLREGTGASLSRVAA